MADYPITQDPLFAATMKQLVTSDKGHASVFNERYQVLLDNDNHLKTETDKIKAVKLAALPVQGWSSEAPYIQTVTVAGVTVEDTPYVSPYIPPGSTADEEKAIKKAAGCVSYIDTGDGQITVTCLGKKPVTDFQVQIKGV